MVVSAAPSFQYTSSSLLAIKDLPFPPESVSTQIANSLPDVATVQVDLAEREDEIMVLAKRSLTALEAWYQLVEGFNGCIAEWDERLRDMETKLLRKERSERDAEEY